MFLTAYEDAYGNVSRFSLSDFRKILDLLDAYMRTSYNILTIRQDNVKDPNGRIDIEVEYVDTASKHLIHQKLLILNNEVIDGKTFHKRYSEWYK